MSGHDHDHSRDDGHDHGHDHDHTDGGRAADVSGWLASVQKATCPACGAAGAVSLGGGLFCPTCGEVSTNPGYQAAPSPAADPD
jgi:hypothetical protein